jgi:hypothetical protein
MTDNPQVSWRELDAEAFEVELEGEIIDLVTTSAGEVDLETAAGRTYRISADGEGHLTYAVQEEP